MEGGDSRRWPFAARDAELALLVEHPRGAVIVGSAGVGKTRLVAEVAARLHEQGSAVLLGRCAEDVLVPYDAIAEAIRPLCSGEDPFANAPGATVDPAAERHRLFEDVDRVLASRPGMVVLALDDVQWLDLSGMRLLRHLLHHSARSSLLVLCTGRPEATDPRHPLAAVFAESEQAGTLEVIGLNYYHTPGFSVGYGFDSIAVALLGRSHPIGVIPAALLFGGLGAGASRMQFLSQIPIDVIRLIQGLVLVFVAAPALIRWLYRVPLPREAAAPAGEAQFGTGWGRAEP